MYGSSEFVDRQREVTMAIAAEPRRPKPKKITAEVAALIRADFLSVLEDFGVVRGDLVQAYEKLNERLRREGYAVD